MMLDISDQQFQAMINKAFDKLPVEHRDNVKNVAILFADEPTPEQRVELKLHCNQTLLGLYQGVPLSQRQGRTDLPPDRITLFKNPILMMVGSSADLQEQIYHTLWHEVAHYYGLDHDKIHDLENEFFDRR